MTEEQFNPEELDEALAAELALGLLEGAEAQAVVTRLAQDPGFAQRVRDWQERLAGMANELTPVMPPARARQRIREELGHAQAPLSQVLDSRIRWWQRPWALFSGLAAVAAVALLLLMPGLRQADQPDYQAQIVSQDASMRVAARLDGRQIEIALQSGTPAQGRDWEIWWVKPDGSAPVSLGLVSREGVMRTELPEGLEMVEGVQIALSDEPQGGSPTGQATGAVMGIAPLTRS